MKSQLPAPWMLGSKNINEIPMLVVYMSNGELEGLDDLQGGPTIDEETGIREYSELSEIIEIPEVKELFYRVVNEAKQNNDEMSEDVKDAYKIAKSHSLPYRETEEEEHNPLRALERKGRHGDSKLAYLPENFIAFLIELGYHPTINPKEGLLEFWALNKLWGGHKKQGKIGHELLRVIGTVGGAILGGPVGAGAGNALAGLATGKSLKNSVVSGLKTGSLAYGAQGLGQMAGLGAATPYTAGFFGGAPNMVASGLGGLGKAMGLGPATAAASAAAVPQIGAQQAIQQAAENEPGFFNHILGGIGKLAPLAPIAMGALSYMGEKQQHKHMQKERERQEAKWDRERKQMGWETNWAPITSKKYEENPEFWNRTEEDIKHGRIHAPYMREVGTSGKYATGGLVQSYSKGTLVKGKGKGQDDLIKTSVPEASYIVDASTTSMLGDGSSEAGAKALKEFENHVRKKTPKNTLRVIEKEVKKSSKQVPVWLSDREYKFDPVTVTLAGRGSNEKGADILRSAIKNIRKHKSSAGSGLPPKAKPLLDYMSA